MVDPAQAITNPDATRSVIHSHCKVCTNQCGVVADVVQGRITRVRGDFAHPLSKGYTCPKGRAIGQLHHHPQAITRPLIRRDGALVAADWDAVLDDLAARLAAVIARYGPNAVGFYFGSGLGMDSSGYRMGEAFYHTLGGHAPRPLPKFSPLTIDGTAKLLVCSLVGGFPGLAGKTDYEHVDMLLYVGVNPMVSHGHNSGMFNPAGPIRAVAARGQVWTMDPLFTETARFSTRHIAPRPGRDYIILAWLVREILADGPLAPAQPVAGLDGLKQALAGLSRAEAAAIAGVGEGELADLLAAIRHYGGVTVETGTGVTMTDTANLTQWFAWVLMILTGRMNRPGGMWFHPGFLAMLDGGELPLLDQPFTPSAPTMPHVRGIIGEWPCAALPGEITAGNIRALINLGGSLIRSFPDTNQLAPALARLEIMASFEIIANETTAASSHVLPTKDQAERPDISFWDTLAASNSMLYSPAITAPMGERRSAWWVIAALMRRMGLAVPPHVPEDDRTEGADDAMLAAQMAGARCSFAELQAAGVVIRPFDLPAAWVDRHIARISGWRLAPEPLLFMWHTTYAKDRAALLMPPSSMSPSMPPEPATLHFIPRRQRRKLNASFSFLGSPADIILHPDDAAARGITDGGKVYARSARGAIPLIARVSADIRRGVASIPHGHEVANVNLLTNADTVDPLTGMAHYAGIAIEVTPE